MENQNPSRNRKPTAYTREEFQSWNTDMMLKRPVTRHVEDVVQGVNLVSFDIHPSANGLRILAVNRYGEEMMLLLNPVLAAALAEGITQCGRKANWLEEDGTPTSPT